MNTKDPITESHGGYHYGNRTKIKEGSAMSFKYLSDCHACHTFETSEISWGNKGKTASRCISLLRDEYPSYVKYSDGCSSVFPLVPLSI